MGRPLVLLSILSAMHEAMMFIVLHVDCAVVVARGNDA
jgi:hypothetical protein